MTMKCPACGTEYPKGVEADDGSCDWCPGVEPVPMPVQEEALAEHG
jgi:hypothetical protein